MRLWPPAGGDAIKGDFDKSILGRVWNDPGVQDFYKAVKTPLWAKVQQEAGEPNEVKQIRMALNTAQSIVRWPIVLGVAAVKGAPAGDRPPVYGFAILDAGTRKAQLETSLELVETLVGGDRIIDVNVGSARMRCPKGLQGVCYWGWSGSYLVLAVNDASGAVLQCTQKSRAALPEYLKKVPSGGDALVIHANIQKATGLINSFARQTDHAEIGETMTSVLKELGLSNVKAFTSRAGFAGDDVVTGSFLEAPGPRTGLLAGFKPMDASVMELVDARAVTTGAINLDVAGLYDTVMRTIKVVSGEAYANVEKGLAAFESETKVSVRKGLLGSLGGPAVFYSLGTGTMPEAPMGGLVVLIKLKDAKSFETTMTGLGSHVAAQSKGAFRASEQARDDGRTVHSWIMPQLAMMQVMPTWSIANDYAVIGSNTAVHDAALKQVVATGEGRTSVTGTARYKEAVPRMPDGLVSLSYADSQTQYTQVMTALRQFWPMAMMFAGQAGIQLPPALPSLDQIIKDMKPSCRSGWMGPDGFYTQYRGPGIEVSLKSVAGVSLGMGVLMPALARTRQLAFRMTSGTNLSVIGKACLIYVNDHDDKLPPDLETLIREEDLSPKTLESKLKPKDFKGPSYVYIAGQTVEMYPGNIVAYDNPEFCLDGVNVLFLDSHVEFMKPEDFRRELRETCERLGRPMPEIRFKGEMHVKPKVPKSVPPSTT